MSVRSSTSFVCDVKATQTIISLERQEEIHCSANGSLGAVRDWQQFGAKRPDNVPPVRGTHSCKGDVRVY
jgi:hypothetical protein